MTLQLDHVFILVEPEAKMADRLLESGFQEGPSNTHPGQGTANRRFYFANGMLEFLWVRDADEVNAGPGRELRFPERAIDSAASSFGVIFVPCQDAASGDRPFPAGIINRPTFHRPEDSMWGPTPTILLNRSVSTSRSMILGCLDHSLNAIPKGLQNW
ncbi:MAG: VOC family protein [Cyanobacteria bacterium P01_D01_bin.115]